MKEWESYCSTFIESIISTMEYRNGEEVAYETASLPKKKKKTDRELVVSRLIAQRNGGLHQWIILC